MKRKKRLTFIVTILLHAVLLITVYMFQGAIFPHLRIGGIVPLFLPVAVTGIALYEGSGTGGICGLFAGMLCDVSFNQPVGVFTVVLTAVGICVGILSDTILLSGFITYYISCAAVLVFCAFVQMTPIVAIPNDIPISSILGTIAAQTLYSLILAFPTWFFVRALGKRADSISPQGRKV